MTALPLERVLPSHPILSPDSVIGCLALCSKSPRFQILDHHGRAILSLSGRRPDLIKRSLALSNRYIGKYDESVESAAAYADQITEDRVLGCTRCWSRSGLAFLRHHTTCACSDLYP